MSTKHKKRLSTSLSIRGKCILNQWWDITTHPPEWLRWTSLTIPNADKAAEQRETSCVFSANKMAQLASKSVWQCLIQLNGWTHHNPASLLLGHVCLCGYADI